MPSSNSSLRTEYIGVIFFIAAIIFVNWFRIFVPHNVGLPINDGGIVYRKIMGMQANNYRLLEYFHFNGLNIPFAYPPLHSILQD